MNIIVEGHSTTVTAPVSVINGPAITVGVEVPERPELTFSVLVEPEVINVTVQSGQSGTQTYTHTQTTPLTEWSVNHPFGSVPASLLLLNASGKYMIPDTAEVSAQRVVLLFGTPTAGTLRLTKG